MVKTVKVLRMQDAREDHAWALEMSDSEWVALATKLTRDLWCAAHGGTYPGMDRTFVQFRRWH